MPYSLEIIAKYLETLNDIEKIALQIAKEDLGTSFNIEKSIGFLEFSIVLFGSIFVKHVPIPITSDNSLLLNH